MRKITALLLPMILLLLMLLPTQVFAETGSDSHDDLPPAICRTANNVFVARNGSYALLDDKVVFYRDQVEINAWDRQTTDGDFLFSDESTNQVYAMIGERIYAFNSGNMVHKASNIISYSQIDQYFYAIYMVGNDLFFWSPMFSHFIAEDVDEAELVYGHLLYRINKKVYAVNVALYNLAHTRAEYDELVPIPTVLLGKGEIQTYADELLPTEDAGYIERAANFDRFYGLNRFIWREY